VSDHLKLDGGHLIHNAAGDLVTECGGQYTFDIYPGHSTDWNISEKFTPGAGAKVEQWSEHWWVVPQSLWALGLHTVFFSNPFLTVGATYPASVNNCLGYYDPGLKFFDIAHTMHHDATCLHGHYTYDLLAADGATEMQIAAWGDCNRPGFLFGGLIVVTW